MKKLVFALAMVAFGQSAFSQTQKTAAAATAAPAYEKVMTEKVNKLQSTHNLDDFTALSNDFTRIADKEKTQWLPYYYTALAQLQKGRMLMGNQEKLGELDAIADASDKNIAKADELSPMNSEIYILKKMSHSLRMMANPRARFMTEGALAKQALEMARKLNPENPRIILLEAEDTYYTPEQFGGSKSKGLELFQKALEQFKNFKPKTNLDPNWGQKEAEYFLAKKP